MGELTKFELEKVLAGPTRWDKIRNWWKNLSWLWSPNERQLQAHINQLHDDIESCLDDDAGDDWDYCDDYEVR